MAASAPPGRQPMAPPETQKIDAEIRDVIYGTGTRREPTNYDRAILRGLQQLRHVYQGTVDPAVVAHRRRRNKAARRSRRLNRLAS
ncbi:hypothetical protein [Mycobacterium intracellulare]|uniref:hypothetical protein n=1 Tax=Mycobacterium intracellulare TaxID=1767 RepID=UPI0010423858|nr:hypothetical protein [Mycobacterium intracellulare]